MFLKTFTVTATPVISKINVDLYRNLLMHGAIFQGIFGGMVAGVMGERFIWLEAFHSNVNLSMCNIQLSTLILCSVIYKNFMHLKNSPSKRIQECNLSNPLYFGSVDFSMEISFGSMDR